VAACQIKRGACGCKRHETGKHKHGDTPKPTANQPYNRKGSLTKYIVKNGLTRGRKATRT
jgi:hypothetical protein